MGIESPVEDELAPGEGDLEEAQELRAEESAENADGKEEAGSAEKPSRAVGGQTAADCAA